ncbi:winged helix-turn-helix transcriptional regulator [Sorangium sp. So ce1504]|uniref:winged helix-turn-helix transcriptional regulator n=1 Tax=Sorangium sp. So ce1504 TaxID=3133337 RepID=UPI003F5F4493
MLSELREGPLPFRALRARCDDLSPTSLSARLADLRAARLVEPSDEGYRLAPMGAALLEALRSLARWSEEWALLLRGAALPGEGADAPACAGPKKARKAPPP